MIAVAPSAADAARQLMHHPAVTEMANDLLAATPAMRATLLASDGAPTYRFIYLANARFAELTGGQHGPLLGTIAAAVTARLTELLALAATELLSGLLAALPDEVTEARAAELEARQAIRDMWRHGFPGCPLTRYATTAGNLADRLAAEPTH